MNDLRYPIDEARGWRVLHEVCDTVVEQGPFAKPIPLSGNANLAQPAKPETRKWRRWGDRVAAKSAKQRAISAARETEKDQTRPVRQPDATQ